MARAAELGDLRSMARSSASSSGRAASSPGARATIAGATVRRDQVDHASAATDARPTLDLELRLRAPWPDRRSTPDSGSSGRRRCSVAAATRRPGGRSAASGPGTTSPAPRAGCRPSPRATTSSGSRSTTTVDPAADAWWAPIETVSNSEDGFERVYQGSGAAAVVADRGSRPVRPRTRTIGHGRDDRPRRRAGDGVVSRPRLVVHGHFYQPPRLDPFSGVVPPDPTAAPARDWNARITAECYRPNAELGNLGRAVVEPRTDARRLARRRGPEVAYRGFTAGDRRHQRDGPAVPPRHPAAGLARSTASRRSAGACAISSSASDAGRPACGCPRRRSTWRRCGLLADEGVDPHDPRSVAGRRPAISTPAGRSACDARRRALVVAVLTTVPAPAAVSFEPAATGGRGPVRPRATRVPRFGQTPLPDGETPLVVIATDGELYGHHQPLRDLFLAAARRADRGGRPGLRRGPAAGRGVAAGGPATGLPDRGVRGADVVELPPRRGPLVGASARACPTGAGRHRSGPRSTGSPAASTP